MQGVVPATGEGTRLRPLTADKPKGMVEVAGKPLLTHVFETLLDAGVTELVVIVGYEMDSIVAHYGDEFHGVPVTYVHQREQLGLAHAVLQAEPHVDGQFVVLNGDNVLGAAVKRATEPGVDAALLVEEGTPEAARETGVAEIKEGRVTGLAEKPDESLSRLATTGCYVLPEEVLAAAGLLQPSARGERELTDAVGGPVRPWRQSSMTGSGVM